ncbi:MAG TPA: hypothetical protein VGK89_00775 [Candidatus Eisenbacteria bacterium]|jgi:hypothetical protein
MLKKILLALAGLVVAAAGFFVVAMGPRNVIGMLRYDTRREGRLEPGDRAPEVELVALDGRSPVPLLGAPRGRPLVLVFGSFT